MKRRSSVDAFKRNECFFCQGKDSSKTGEQTHACQSANSAKAIREIVEKSGNRLWKLQLADVIAEDDFLARDVVYHKSCKTKHWKTYIQAPKRRNAAGETDARLIAAEMEFYDDLNERIRGGELISSTDAEKLYRDMMEDHKITDYSISRKVLMEDIRRYLPNIVCTEKKGSKPSLLHSKSISRDGIDIVTEERDVEKSLKTLFKSAKIIRSKIIDAKKDNLWSFSGTLETHSEYGVPVELMLLIRWLLPGSNVAKTGARQKSLHKSCLIISQIIMQEFKNTRQVTHSATSDSALSMFRKTYESPFAVGLSLWMYHNLRSQETLNLLNNMCVGISYSRVTQVCSQIANAVIQNINEYGVYVPSGVVKGQFIRASGDNVDKKVDTKDGKNSFHAMAMCVYQRRSNGDPLVRPVDLFDVSPASLSSVPSTCIKLEDCSITGNPKPHSSPSYEAFKLGSRNQYLEESRQNDIAWLIARNMNHSYQDLDQNDLMQVPLGATTAASVEDVVDIDGNEETLDAAVGTPFDEPVDVNGTHTSSNQTQSREIDFQTENVSSQKEISGQKIPIWSAYNALLNVPPNDAPLKSSKGDHVFTLPIINAPAHEWPTLKTTLDQLCKLNDLVSSDDGKLAVTFDMDIYKRALKLQHMQHIYKELVLCPGAFHMSICAL